MVSSSRIAATNTTANQEKEKQQVIVRINGVLPDITKIGTQERSAHRKICEHFLLHICKKF
ncbi:MAG: hypothetical protein WA941_01350 [Nitrososphaeraceae archaeon]